MVRGGERGFTLPDFIAEVVVVAAAAGREELTPLYHCGGRSWGRVLQLEWKLKGHIAMLRMVSKRSLFTSLEACRAVGAKSWKWAGLATWLHEAVQVHRVNIEYRVSIRTR